MTVTQKDITELLFFREATRKNLNTCNVTESLTFRYMLRSNIKIFKITETLVFSDKASKSAGIVNLSVLDTLSFIEAVHPRSNSYDAADVLALVEWTTKDVGGDSLEFAETVEFQLLKTLSDELTLVETVGMNISKFAAISETLNLNEGCTGISAEFGGAYTDINSPFCNFGSPLTQETPSGSIDGSNKVFTLSQVLSNPETLCVWINNRLSTGFALTGGDTITFNTALNVGDVLLAYYRES